MSLTIELTIPKYLLFFLVSAVNLFKILCLPDRIFYTSFYQIQMIKDLSSKLNCFTIVMNRIKIINIKLLKLVTIENIVVLISKETLLYLINDLRSLLSTSLEGNNLSRLFAHGRELTIARYFNSTLSSHLQKQYGT